MIGVLKGKDCRHYPFKSWSHHTVTDTLNMLKGNYYIYLVIKSIVCIMYTFVLLFK